MSRPYGLAGSPIGGAGCGRSEIRHNARMSSTGEAPLFCGVPSGGKVAVWRDSAERGPSPRTEKSPVIRLDEAFEVLVA